ncbi:MAG: fatty acid--CoA ligase [Chitinophagales bacterium]|nr:fatty acid--CoA ligase [Chitinophagales bacterium]
MKTTRIIERTPSAYAYPLLIKSILQNSLKYQPDNEIIYRDTFRMNYRDLNKRVAQLANVLTSIGVKEGDVIGVVDFDSHRYLELYFAIPMVGAVLHTINYRLSPQQILYTMNHAEDKYVFCHEELLPLIEAVAPELETVEKYILLTDGKIPEEPKVKLEGEYEALLKAQSGTYDFPDFDENTMASLFYTTGTTGNPKGVYFSHRQLVLHTITTAMNIGVQNNVINISSTDNYMPITPMFHVHAWGFPYIATMLGMKQVYPGKYEPLMLVKLIQTEKITISHCVPTILGMLVNSPVATQYDWYKWKVIIGGSALPQGLARSAMKLGISVMVGYGMSETCPVLSLAHLNDSMLEGMSEDEIVEERCKTGRPIALVDMQIMDDDGKFLPWDGETMGEIVARTPWLTQGYFKEDTRSVELWEHGYLHTGDIATVEPNGTFMIRDRKKDVIKTGGEWVSSLEIENLISQVGGIAEVAVVGVHHEKWQERPVALVVLSAGVQVSAGDITDYLNQFVDTGDLSKWAVPDEIRFVDAIPKTSVGKIDKKKIRAEFV